MCPRCLSTVDRAVLLDPKLNNNNSNCQLLWCDFCVRIKHYWNGRLCWTKETPCTLYFDWPTNAHKILYPKRSWAHTYIWDDRFRGSYSQRCPRVGGQGTKVVSFIESSLCFRGRIFRALFRSHIAQIANCGDCHFELHSSLEPIVSQKLMF